MNVAQDRIMAPKKSSKKTEPSVPQVVVKLNANVAHKARLVANFEGKSLAKWLSDTLDPITDRDLRKHAGKVLAPKKGE